MEQFIILVIIGLISLVKWVLEKSAEHKAARRTEEPIDGVEEDHRDARPETDAEEQRRRFMEALGLPVDDPEPEIQIRREAAPPPIPEREPVRNFLHKVSDDLERRLVPERETEPVEPIKLVPTRFAASRRHRPVKAVAAPTDPGGSLDFLKAPGGLRRAILAREVLGPCKGLEFDLPGIPRD